MPKNYSARVVVTTHSLMKALRLTISRASNATTGTRAINVKDVQDHVELMGTMSYYSPQAITLQVVRVWGHVLSTALDRTSQAELQHLILADQLRQELSEEDAELERVSHRQMLNEAWIRTMSGPVHRDVISIEDDSDEEDQEERNSSVSGAESDSDMGPMSRVDEEEQPTKQSTRGATGVRTGHSPRGMDTPRHAHSESESYLSKLRRQTEELQKQASKVKLHLIEEAKEGVARITREAAIATAQ